MKITQEVRAFAIEQAGRRCECTGGSCGHHLRGVRCKRGLRGDDWKVFWKTEGGGATRKNLEAWCLGCFANNFEIPRETVVLLAPDLADYVRLESEDRRRAITLKSVLRDASDRTAPAYRGRLVLERLDDDLLLEFATTDDAVGAARGLWSGFRELVQRLDLPTPEIRGAIHRGEVTRWRNGVLAGDTVDATTSVRNLASLGQIVLTAPAVDPLSETSELERFAPDAAVELPPVGDLWALRL